MIIKGSPVNSISKLADPRSEMPCRAVVRDHVPHLVATQQRRTDVPEPNKPNHTGRAVNPCHCERCSARRRQGAMDNSNELLAVGFSVLDKGTGSQFSGPGRFDTVTGAVCQHDCRSALGIAPRPVIATYLLARIRREGGAEHTVPGWRRVYQEPAHQDAALAGTRIDLQGIRELCDRPQTVARTASSRIAVLQAAARICHTATAVERQHFQPDPAGVIASTGMNVPTAAMLQQVGGKFGHHDGHSVDAGLSQPHLDREFAYLAPSLRDLACVADLGEHPRSIALWL